MLLKSSVVLNGGWWESTYTNSLLRAACQWWMCDNSARGKERSTVLQQVTKLAQFKFHLGQSCVQEGDHAGNVASVEDAPQIATRVEVGVQCDNAEVGIVAHGGGVEATVAEGVESRLQSGPWPKKRRGRNDEFMMRA